jgi:hypothetical protein
LGNTSGQERALAEYQRLHERTTAQNGIEPISSPRDVTRQEIEPAER